MPKKGSRRSRAASHIRRHPKLLTKAINATGALIAFNQEISGAFEQFQAGSYQNIPKVVAAKGVGLTDTGQIDYNQLTASITSKAAGYAFTKIAKFFLRRFRM